MFTRVLRGQMTSLETRQKALTESADALSREGVAGVVTRVVIVRLAVHGAFGAVEVDVTEHLQLHVEPAGTGGVR